MFRQTAALAILGVALLTAGCSDSDNTFAATAPSPLRVSDNGTTFSTRVDPLTLSARASGLGACPVFEPFLAPLTLGVQAGDVGLQLLEVRMQFLDALGTAAPQVTLPAPALTAQFGTALVQARSFRSFPLDFLFGCGTGRRGTIVVIVHTRDERGRDRFDEARVSVR